MFGKLAFLCVTFTFLFATGIAQPPCGRSIAESPSLAGFRLGMSIDETQAALGSKYKIPKKKTGEGSYFEDFAKAPAVGDLSGVHALFLRFFNFKLYQIEIFYEDPAKPKKLEEFTQSLSSNLDLPPDAWHFKNQRAEINCGDFAVTADTLLNPHVELTDDAAYKQFQEKQQEDKKKARK